MTTEIETFSQCTVVLVATLTLMQGIDNFSITKRMLIKRDVTSGVHYCSLLEYFAIAVTTYTAGILTTCACSMLKMNL